MDNRICHIVTLCLLVLLGNPRKTVAGSGAPPEESVSFFAVWWRASAPFALLYEFPAPAQQTKPQLPDGPGKETFQRVCSGCHGAEIVIGRGLTEEGWTEVVANMVSRGAKGTDEEFGQIVQYLATNFPPKTEAKKVNINKASADDIKAVLELSTKDAEAIVAYRGRNGDFKTAEDVKKVPGVDATKIEVVKDRMSF